jgi:hypothetical protein
MKQENWVVENGWRLPRIEVTGDIGLRRPRPAQGCKADDDDDEVLFKTSSSQSSPYTSAYT